MEFYFLFFILFVPDRPRKSLRLFDFRSLSLRAVYGDIIFRVSFISSRTSAGTLPLPRV
jgi:hypothetical protein